MSRQHQSLFRGSARSQGDLSRLHGHGTPSSALKDPGKMKASGRLTYTTDNLLSVPSLEAVHSGYRVMVPRAEGGSSSFSSSSRSSKRTLTASSRLTSRAASRTSSRKASSPSSSSSSRRSTTTRPRITSSSRPARPVSDAVTVDTSSSLGSVLAQATGTAPSRTGALGDDRLFPTTFEFPGSSPTDSASTNQSGQQGSSTQAKVGIAFGVIGGVIVVSLLVFFLYSRRRKRQRSRREKIPYDEKKNISTRATSTPSRSATPRAGDAKLPRISLRPITQLLPNWNSFDKRASKYTVTPLTPAPPAPPAPPRAPGRANWARSLTAPASSPSSANPFGNGAERSQIPVIREHGLGDDRTSFPSTVFEETDAADSASLGAGADGSIPILTRSASMRQNAIKDLDLTLPGRTRGPPPSPVGTEYSISSATTGATQPSTYGAAAIAAAGGPSNARMYRVQLDFKPTLEDEMELRAGEMVRLLHEYDDGWCLVIRPDRSQQGVVPRTCLSTRPVKSRPGPRVGPPLSPSGHPRKAYGVTSPRPMSPQSTRSMTPLSTRSMTPPGVSTPLGIPPTSRPDGSSGSTPPPPHSAGFSRPTSPGSWSRRMSPPGPSPMNPSFMLGHQPRSGSPAFSGDGAVSGLE